MTNEAIETSRQLAEALVEPPPPAPSSDCDLLLVDVSHLFWSAWHASAAEEVGAAFSTTIDKLNSIRSEVKHKRMLVCIDWPPYWRVEAHSEYKAQRARPSEFAVEQFKRIKARIAADGHELAGVKGYEADDIIATATKQALELGLSVTIATGDKDLMQLVCDTVRIYNTRTGAVFGVPEVVAQYGVPPEKIRDLLTLTGDKSDNIPGVRGIGQKKAAWLINTFGGWEQALFNAADPECPTKFQPAMRQALLDHWTQDYQLAWQLIGLRTDAPISLTFVPTGEDSLSLEFRAQPAPTPAPKPTATTEGKPKGVIATMSKMSLANVTRGVIREPYNILVYGPEGCGKTTFAANAPSPIFFDLEHGSAELDVARMPDCGDYQDVLAGLNLLLKESHAYKTVVIDTADILEILIHEELCRKNGWEDIDAPGFGKGQEAAVRVWDQMMGQLKELNRKGMHTVILGHSSVKAFSNPRGEDYDRFQIQLAKKAEELVKNRVKAVLFATYEDAIKKEKKKKAKALGDGKRIMYTQYRPAFAAKNRYGLPFELPLNWAEFDAAAQAGVPASLDEFHEELEALKPQLSEEFRAKLLVGIEKAGDDGTKLAFLVDWARNKVEREEEVAA